MNEQELINNEDEKNKVFKVLKASFWMGLGALITAVISLILGSTAVHKTAGLSYFLNRDHSATWGDTKIWEFKNDGVHIYLYFGNVKQNSYDIEWNGVYPQGYFNN